MVNTNLVSIKINNIPLQVPEGTRILDACRDNGFHVPYLCYLKDINEIGACRVCVVEVKGIHHLVTSCNNQVQEGMEILTNSPRVREARKINVELLLSQHHTNCPTCVRSSNCELKQVASDLEPDGRPLQKRIPGNELDFYIPTDSRCWKMHQMYALRPDL